MGIITWLVKAIIGSILKKLVVFAVLTGGGLYVAHSMNRLAPMATMLNQSADSIAAAQPEGFRRDAVGYAKQAASWYLENHADNAATNAGPFAFAPIPKRETATQPSGWANISAATAKAVTVSTHSPAGNGDAGFYETAARVSAVNATCRLEGKHGGIDARTKPMDCNHAQTLAASGRYPGLSVERSASVEFIYYAPDGRTVLTNTYVPRSGERKTVGSTIDVRVSLSDPSQAKPM